MTNDNQLADIGQYDWPAPDVTFHGRHVWSMGEDGDWGIYIAGHGRRALAALNAYHRDLQGSVWHTPGRFKPQETWVRLLETCGCTKEAHARHIADADADGLTACDDDCDDSGLPPCRDYYAWHATSASPGEHGAVPMTVVRW